VRIHTLKYIEIVTGAIVILAVLAYQKISGKRERDPRPIAIRSLTCATEQRQRRAATVGTRDAATPVEDE
jgi:hypothetical protein